MLSLPDFKEKQIVFIESNETEKIQFRNDNLVLVKEEEVAYQISCYKIFCVFIIGETTITSVLIKKALSYGISLILMNRNFDVYSVIGAETEGNYLLRLKQYNLASPLNIAKHIVHNKSVNQLTLLKDIRKKDEKIKQAIGNIEKLIIKIGGSEENQELLGYEGNISKMFFQTYFKEMHWRARLPRTKYDITNTLLDIGYTYLFNFIDAHLRLYGFDTYMGFYHQLFYQRKSLVCDLQEPFRCIIDKAVLLAHHLGQVDEKDFTTRNHKYELEYKNTKKYTKIFLEAIMTRKEDIFVYIQQFYRCLMKGDNNYPRFFI